MIIYGRNPVAEALRGRRAASVADVWATARAAREPWLAGIAPRIVSAEQIERRCGSPPTRGSAPRPAHIPTPGVRELLSGHEPLIVALDQVQDPQNLGSICRTAECVGAAGVVIPDRRAAAVTPAVCKASAGAVEHLRVAHVRNIADFLGRGPRGRLLVLWGERALGAARGRPPAGDQRAAVRYDAPDYRGSGVVLVLGSEGRGLRPRVASACDELISLPQLGQRALARRQRRRRARFCTRSCRPANAGLDNVRTLCKARAHITLNLRLKRPGNAVSIALAPGEECATEQGWGCSREGRSLDRGPSTAWSGFEKGSARGTNSPKPSP